MEIERVLNSNKEKIVSKKLNFFIAISLGNKWFTKENLRKYLNLCLKLTEEKVCFLIGDKIQAINYNVRNNNKRSYNLKRALKNGEKVKKIIEEIILELSEEKQNRIIVLRWEEYEEKDKFYKKYTPKIYQEFKENKSFKEEILNIVKNSITDKKFTEEEYLELTKYILEEFILTYSGIRLEEEYFGAYLYPKLFPIASFIEKIQQGKLFPELNEKLSKEKVALAIVN